MTQQSELREQIESTLYKHITSFQAVSYEDTTDDIMQLITNYTNKQIEEVLDRIEKFTHYNKHDMGEMGKFIRIEYVNNCIKAERNRLKGDK